MRDSIRGNHVVIRCLCKRRYLYYELISDRTMNFDQILVERNCREQAIMDSDTMTSMSRHSMICACRRRQSQSLSGNSASVLHRMDMKWFFHVRMARSATLRRWLPAGVSWKSTLISLRKTLNSLDILLSNCWYCGRKPCDVRMRWISLYAVSIDTLVRLGIALTRIALLS